MSGHGYSKESQVNNLESAISKIAFPSHLIDPKTRLDKHGLMASSNILEVLASEKLSRVDRPCNVIFFIVRDPIPMNDLRDQLWAAIGVAHIPRLMMGLRERTQRLSCPPVLQIRTKF